MVVLSERRFDSSFLRRWLPVQTAWPPILAFPYQRTYKPGIWIYGVQVPVKTIYTLQSLGLSWREGHLKAVERYV